MIYSQNYKAIYVKGIITLITAMIPIIIKTKKSNKKTMNCMGEVFLLKLPRR